MKMLIAGSRSIGYDRTIKDVMYDYDEQIIHILDSLYAVWKPTLVISGNAMGVDEIGECWARNNGIELKIFKPDWEKYGKSAGMRRNEEMVSYCDKAIIFWDGLSKGSKNTIDLLHRTRKEHVIWRVQNDQCIW